MKDYTHPHNFDFYYDNFDASSSIEFCRTELGKIFDEEMYKLDREWFDRGDIMESLETSNQENLT